MSAYAAAAARETAARAGRAREGVTPARIMMPRVLYAATALVLVIFGLLMIYSASSIVGLTGESYNHDPAYFLVRQALFAGMGLVACAVLARVDYHVWRGTPLKAAWAVMMVSLLVVYTSLAGRDAYGATRWISLGAFTLQPSEFAKAVIVLVGAQIAQMHWAEGTLSREEALKHLAVGVVLPLALILFQPDKGTTGVVLLTLLVMCYLSGMPGRVVVVIGLAGLTVAMAYALKDDYSRARILTMLDPFRDEWGDGYQLTQGFYALGSGGLAGVGLGMSRQKYNYLPMAHNDFIFAVIGEELGYVGAVALLVAFCVLLWAGLKIAENAPDLTGRLIAAGCTSMLVIQLLLNVSGVVGAFPLSGKPVPFVSYGGSSVISSLMLVGLTLSVSLRSRLPETSYERRRARLRIADGARDASGAMEAPAGEAARHAMAPRSARLASSRGLRVVDGGRPRVDLGPTPAERLRSGRR